MNTDADFASMGPGPPDDWFRIRPASGGGFGAVTAALACKLAWLSEYPEPQNVILEVVDGGWPYYVQVAIDFEDGAWVEAVSNEFIDVAEARLTEGQEARLADLRLTPPNDFSPNHHRLFAMPVDWGTVARLLVDALASVYGAAEHDELELRVFPHWTMEDER